MDQPIFIPTMLMHIARFNVRSNYKGELVVMQTSAGSFILTYAMQASTLSMYLHAWFMLIRANLSL